MIKIIFLLVFFVFSLEAKAYTYTNLLIHSKSPYLLQHAHNPIHWHTWDKKAFTLAKHKHKLIFLSIGYSTCHWCHEMERQSFSNLKVAKILNKYYISIAVDKEQRPDIDRHFQSIYTMMHKRSGGWPLTVFLTPNAKPFFTATYLPRQSKDGYIGLLPLLQYFAKLHRHHNRKIKDAAAKIVQLQSIMSKDENLPATKITSSTTSLFLNGIKKQYDKDNPGINIEPKFPHASAINSLIFIYQTSKNTTALHLATSMLSTMAKGGIYDQLSGGFFRYTTDERWIDPHFEKMLYTNAGLLQDYIKAYGITKKPLYLHVIKQTIAFMQRRFQKNNLYFSATDADSYNPKTKQLQEGAYYLFTYNNAKRALSSHGIKNIKIALAYLGITKNGDFKDNQSNVYINPFIKKPTDIALVKKILLTLRRRRPYPFIDKKILTSWNSLYIKSLFLAGDLNRHYQDMAIKSLNRLISAVYIKHTLYHEKIGTYVPHIKANLEDYSFLIQTLIAGYEKSFTSRYLTLADTLVKQAIRKFYKHHIWYIALKPFKIKATLFNNAHVNPLAIMTDNLLKLAILQENLSYQNMAKTIFIQNSLLLNRYPWLIPQTVVEYEKYKKGFIGIKATKTKLKILKYKLKNRYPLVLYKATNNAQYMACMVNNCFAYSKNADNIIKAIASKYTK